MFLGSAQNLIPERIRAEQAQSHLGCHTFVSFALSSPFFLFSSLTDDLLSLIIVSSIEHQMWQRLSPCGTTRRISKNQPGEGNLLYDGNR